MGGMLAPKALGNEHLDRLTDKLVPLVAEQLLGLRVDENDAPLAIDDYDGVRSGLEESAELVLGAPAVGDVPDGRGDEPPFHRLHWRQADFSGKFGAVLA